MSELMRILITGGSGFIGTHLIDSLSEKKHPIINLDIKAPIIGSQREFWHKCDIRNFLAMKNAFSSFQPTHIIHLAAESCVDGETVADYSTNTVGTKLLLKAVSEYDSVSKVIITSSQHVREPGAGPPAHDEDFIPFKAYGESKVITEKLTREAGLNCYWTIIRPSTIWGPFHEGLTTGLWRVMKKGMYFHPGKDRVIRSYGYVKNTVFQIESILSAKPGVVNEKVLYVGDPCINQYEWVNQFSRNLTGRDVREVPQPLLCWLSLFGDGLRHINIKFPLYTERFKNMTTNNPVPVDETIKLLGPVPYSLQDGVKETVQWIDRCVY